MTMTWLSLIAALIGLASALVKWLSDSGDVANATAAAVLKGLREADEAIAKAKAARALVRAGHDADPARLREDDGHKRD